MERVGFQYLHLKQKDNKTFIVHRMELHASRLCTLKSTC